MTPERFIERAFEIKRLAYPQAVQAELYKLCNEYELAKSPTMSAAMARQFDEQRRLELKAALTKYDDQDKLTERARRTAIQELERLEEKLECQSQTTN